MTARGLARAVRAAAVLATAGASAAPAQGGGSAIPEPGSELAVSIITVGQGDQVWERYGHNALWIQDAVRGTNKTYNWGIFDASERGFIVRFVRGRMRYWMDTLDVGRLLEFYRSFDREIVVQRLALTPAQALALRDFVEWNAREENKFYWYDYFRDNCSTRVRDAVDRALAGALRRATTGRATVNTYRSESVRLMEGMPLTQLGIAIGLGPRSDRPLTAWEEMFVPMRMRDRLREVRVPGPTGAMTPLVADERRIYVARRPPEIQHAPPLARRYALIGFAIAAGLAGLGWRAQLGGRMARAGFAAAAAVWGAVAGIGGVLVLFLWVATHHVFAYRNENLLQLTPIALAVAVLAPLAAYHARRRPGAARAAVAVAGIALAGVAVKALAWFDQRNLPAILLVLPGHLALAWALVRLRGLARTRRATPQSAPLGAPGEAGARRATAV